MIRALKVAVLAVFIVAAGFPQPAACDTCGDCIPPANTPDCHSSPESTEVRSGTVPSQHCHSAPDPAAPEAASKCDESERGRGACASSCGLSEGPEFVNPYLDRTNESRGTIQAPLGAVTVLRHDLNLRAAAEAEKHRAGDVLRSPFTLFDLHVLLKN